MTNCTATLASDPKTDGGNHIVQASEGLNKILVYAGYPLWRKNSLVTFARAKELQEQGHEVTVAYCAAKCGSCVCNQAGNPLVCLICRTATRMTAKRIGLPIVALTDRVPAEMQNVEVTLSERKELVEGALSGLISSFRMLPRDIRRSRILNFFKRRIYATSLSLLKQLKWVMGHRAVDQFEVFNGRHACSKAGIIASRALAVPFNTLEVTASRKPIVHRGYAAHDRQGIQARIRRQPVDMELANQFYENRRRPSGNKFAKRHSQQFQVPTLGRFRRLISIFLSSQDEFASLGKSWKTTFDSDDAIVTRLCEKFPDDLFCIRFHPNQAEIKSDVISGFRRLESLPNVKIYYPQDTANTYQLVDASDLVVVFNSTVAAEACWVGKPVIMIGPSFYDQLDFGYTPRDEQELWELLSRDQLESRNRDNAARLAHYFLRDGDVLKHVRIDDRRVVSDDIQRALPVLTTCARQCNNIATEVIKGLW